eukprot:5493257-Pleurochrysis_carterae.AAC.1
MDVAQVGARARLAPAARPDAGRQEPTPAPTAAPKSLRDLPPGSVAKLTAVKAEASVRGGREGGRRHRPPTAHHNGGHGGGGDGSTRGDRRGGGAPPRRQPDVRRGGVGGDLRQRQI